MTYNDKQLQIIVAAENLFSDKSFDGTSVRDIAEEAGVNVAMISYYFGSKEKLMQAIFEQRTRYMTVKIEGLLKNDDLSPFEKIEAVIDDYVERIAQKQKFYKLMICEQMVQKNPAITDMLNDLKKKNTVLIEKLIKDGQERKAFKKNIDVILLMNTMVGVSLHSFVGKDYYKDYHHLGHLEEEEFQDKFKAQLSKYIKELFKAILSYER